MVSTQALIFMFVTLLISFLLPIILVIYFHRKERISLKAVLVGALVFIVFQMLTRIPLLNYLSAQEWYRSLATNLFFVSLFLSLTAGLFEEVGRFIGFKYFLKNQLERKNGIAYGLGHGGIEAILLVGFTYINNIVISLMINSGTFDSQIGAQLGSQTAAIIKNQLLNTMPLVFAAAGLERIFAMVIQVALSLIVLYGVMEQRLIYLIYAILLHALVNLPAVIITSLGLSLWFSEFYLLIVAVVAYLYINRSKQYFDRRI